MLASIISSICLITFNASLPAHADHLAQLPVSLSLLSLWAAVIY